MIQKALSSFIWSLLICTPLFAQEVDFQQVRPVAPLNLVANFIAVRQGESQFIDVDQDGDLDVFISDGAQLYLNDGNGNFARFENHGIEPLFIGSFRMADFNGDGLLDLVQCGIDTANMRQTQIYQADSLYHFSKISGNSFLGVALSYIDYSDVDGDGDLDFMVVGRDNNNIGKSRMYLNQGNMVFTVNTNFPDVAEASINFEDLDNDNDEDLLLTGNNAGNRISKLYKNNGLGVFTEDTSATIDQVYAGVSHFFDADNDADLDLVLTGDNAAGTRICKLYLNDGLANFTLQSPNNFVESFDGSVSSGYVNNDTLLDLIVTGFDALEVREQTNIYLNVGNAQFVKDTVNSVERAARGSTDFADINNDGFDDLLISGDTRFTRGVSSIYLNNGLGVLSRISGSAVEYLNNPKMDVLDINNDGSADLFVQGRDVNTNTSIQGLYLNNGSAQLSKTASNSLPELIYDETLSKDFNNDGYDDILLSGRSGFKHLVELYLNNQNGDFLPAPTNVFDSLEANNMLFFDANNDSIKDILINGLDKDDSMLIRLYKGTATNNYLSGENLGIHPFASGSMDAADVDGDGDMDLLIIGADSNRRSIAELYLNNNGQFSSAGNVPFEKALNNKLKFVDIDNDGDMDVFLNGSVVSRRFLKLYLNDGLGNFSEFIGYTFETLLFGNMEFLDIDGDGYLDIYFYGTNDNGIQSHFYLQYNALDFRRVPISPIDGFISATSTVVDMNNDNIDDLVIAGLNDEQKYVTKIYTNNSCQVSLGTNVITACDSYFWLDSITYFNDNNSARYRIENGDMNGCDSVITLDLTVNYSSQAIEADTACNEYIWRGRLINTAGVYFDTIVNTAGCDSIISLNLSVNFVPDSVYRQNDSVFAVIDSMTSIQWVNCSQNFQPIPGADSSFFILPNNDFYAIIVDNGICRDTSDCFSLVGINEASIPSNQLKIQPNPTNGLLYIELEDEQDYTAYLLDLKGSVLDQFLISKRQSQIDLSQFKPGIYFLRIGNSFAKIVKY